MARFHWLTGLTLAISASTLLMSCSSGDPKPATGRIRIGFIEGPLSGANSQRRTDQLLVSLRDINAAGGIELDDGPHELDIMVVDHMETADGVVAALETLAEAGVTAAVGPPWSSLVLGEEDDHSDGAVAAAERLGIVLVSGSATSAEISELDDNDLMWRTAPSDVVQGAVSAEYMIDQGISTAAVLFRGDPWGSGLAEIFKQEFEAGGGTIVAETSYAPEEDAVLATKDFSTELNEVFAAEPEAIYIISFGEAFNIGAQMESGGHFENYDDDSPLLFGTDGFYGDDLLQNAPAAFLSRLLGALGGSDRSTPEYQALREIMSAAGYDEESDIDASRVDAAVLLALSMQAAGSTEAAAITAVLGDVSRDDPGDVEIPYGEWELARETLLAGGTINYEGASGSIEFDDNGDRTEGSIIIWDIVETDDGFAFDNSNLVPYDLSP